VVCVCVVCVFVVCVRCVCGVCVCGVCVFVCAWCVWVRARACVWFVQTKAKGDVLPQQNAVCIIAC